MPTRSIHDQIVAATDLLAKLKAKELLAEQRKKTKAKSDARRADAHRKIELGGLVIAAGARDVDDAELVGALLAYEATTNQDPARRLKFREMGRNHLDARKQARANRK